MQKAIEEAVSIRRNASELRENMSRALASCENYAVGKANTLVSGQSRYSLTVEKWTGACLNGLRDGSGTLDSLLEFYVGDSFTSQQGRMSATFAAGRLVGLSCHLTGRSLHRHPALDGGKSVSTQDYAKGMHGGLCQLRWVGAAGEDFMRDAEGRWLQYLARKNWRNDRVEPLFTLAPGALEAAGDAYVVAAKKGAIAPPELAAVNASSPAFDGVTTDGTLSYALRSSAQPFLYEIMAGKRVALILSDRMIREVARYQQERGALLAKSQALTGHAAQMREEFALHSEPRQLLRAIGLGFSNYSLASELVPARDLGVLTRGEADVAVIVDWTYRARFDLLGKFKIFKADHAKHSFPMTGLNEEIPFLFYHTLSFYAVDASGQLLAGKRVRDQAGYANDYAPEACRSVATKDCIYFAQLGMAFQTQWRTVDVPLLSSFDFQ